MTPLAVARRSDRCESDIAPGIDGKPGPLKGE
jgi:hypothetical protein